MGLIICDGFNFGWVCEITEIRSESNQQISSQAHTRVIFPKIILVSKIIRACSINSLTYLICVGNILQSIVEWTVRNRGSDRWKRIVITFYSQIWNRQSQWICNPNTFDSTQPITTYTHTLN